MAADERYLRQVELLVRMLPFVAEERCFALKGGTAINLFVRDLPRLSVDIDLAYLPIEDRDTSLRSIAVALERIGTRIEHALPSCRIDAVLLRTEGTVNRLFVRDRGVQVKIEVTPVLRGCVYEPESRSVSAGVEKRFGFAAMQVVSFADLYAGKLVAALDRQHPLAAVAVAVVAAGLLILAVEVVVQLGVEDAFRQRLLQVLDQLAALKRLKRVRSSQQLIQQLVRNRRFAFVCVFHVKVATQST